MGTLANREHPMEHQLYQGLHCLLGKNNLHRQKLSNTSFYRNFDQQTLKIQNGFFHTFVTICMG